MKKFFAVLLTAVMIVTSLAVPVMAKTEKVAGGFDFYSITVHYSTPVVVSYDFVKKSDGVPIVDYNGTQITDENGKGQTLNSGYVFSKPSSTYVISAAEYALRVNDETITNQIFGYGESALKTTKRSTLQWERRFNSIDVEGYNIDSSNLVYNENFGVTNITNNTAVSLIDAASLYGIQSLYDDAGNKNPNFEFDGKYFVDVNGGRIDDNGFLLDSNNIWHNYENKRVELFVRVGNDYVWVSSANRLDSNGRIVNYSALTNADLVAKGVITAPAGKENDQEWLASKCRFETFVIAYPDEKTTLTDEERAAYDAADRVITVADVETKMVAGEPMMVNGTPVLGTPKTNFSISKITVEIDALGESMPADIASDPQQKNEIYVTIGDVYENIKTALDFVAANPSKEYTKGALVGVAKAVTTKTEMKKENGLPSTVKSVEIAMEKDVKIPANGSLFISFKIQQTQPEAAAGYEFPASAPEGAKNVVTGEIETEFYKLTSLSKEVIDTSSLPDAPVTAKDSGCGSVISGSVAVVALMAAVVVLIRKKED